jgi:hypothetical protein
MESELGGDCLGHKRVDPEGGSSGGNVREGKNGLHSSSMEMEDDEDWEPAEPNPLDLYRECWIESYGCHGISFEDESTSFIADLLPFFFFLIRHLHVML